MPMPLPRAGLLALLTFTFATFSALVADEETVAKRPAWTTSRIHGTPEAPEPYKIVSAFPKLKFERPTSIEQLPGTNRMLVTEMGGRVLSFVSDKETAAADLLIDLKTLLPKELEGRNISLFDAEPHPKFSENRYLFVCYVHPGEGRHARVSRLTLTKDLTPKVVPESELEIIRWPTGGHNGGCLEFGKDGFLYISTGDGAGPNPPDGLTTGQTVSDLLGAILRIDIDQPTKTSAYTVPSDNPFVALAGARPEIWGYGMRNPWKFGVDQKTNEVFVADNGWESWELIHRVPRGGNGGWPVMEGRASLRSEVPVGPTPILPPIKDHPHTEANSVIGGPVYRGKKLAALDGAFIYGDYIMGTIWSVKADERGVVASTLCDTDLRIVAFAEGSGGELYALDYDFTGQIYEIIPSGLKDTSATFPRKLSETGLFKSIESMEPAPGVVPYSIIAERWMDDATAKRWVAVPGDGKIKFSERSNEPTVYPEGTVFAKELTTFPETPLQTVRIETQILHYESGTWRPYTYAWDEDGRDATLVGSVGAKRNLKAKPKLNPVHERTWHLNATNECKLCHNAGPKFVLGFVPNQLNQAANSEPDSPNQLDVLAAKGVIENAPKILKDDPTQLVNPHDEKQSLEDRARSYLHANCAMCHHIGGNAIVSLFLSRELPYEKFNSNRSTGIGTFGIKDAKVIAAGDPYRSLLLYRMSKLGYARMPYIGSQLVDHRGVALIEEWIKTLPNPEPKSGPTQADSADVKAMKAFDETHLLTSTEGALALIGMLSQGEGGVSWYFKSIAAGSQSKSSDIRGLFDTFVPEAQRRPTLGPKIDPQSILKLKGDLERGKLIFSSDGARCRNCHDASDKEKSIGPTLQEINKKYPNSGELLTHVLQPSLKIEEAFAAYSVSTNDGRTLQGLLVEQNDDAVTIKTAERKTIRIPRSDIEDLQKGTKSLMPDLILSDLTAQEAADLFQYIRSLGAGKEVESEK